MIKKFTVFIVLAVIAVFIAVGFFIRYRMDKLIKDDLQVRTVTLSQPADSASIIFETERVVITFGLEDFKNSLKEFIVANPHIKSDPALLVFIEQQAKKSKIVRISDVPFELRDRAEFQIADLLETGKFTLFDKKRNVYHPAIRVETTGENVRPFAGAGGRNFLLPDEDFVFFEVIDWIS